MLAAFHLALASFRIPDEANIALAATDASDFIRSSLHAILATLQNKPRQQVLSRPSRQQSTPAHQILSFIRKHPGSKRQDLLAALPAISQRMLDRHLQTLRDSGQIEYRGSRKTGAYYTL
jgi:DNA-binding HxlR family transcriptional regulator